MGGNMDYARFRNRNSLGYRKPISDIQPYPDTREMPDYLSDEQKGKLYMLIGDLNRMEKNILGLDGMATNTELEYCVKATGVDANTVLKVMRWFFQYPEPYCPDCMEQMKREEKDHANWRCSKHLSGISKEE